MTTSKVDFTIETIHGDVTIACSYPEDHGRALIAALATIGDRLPSLMDQLQQIGDTSIDEFLTEKGLSLDTDPGDEDLYDEDDDQ